MCLHLNAFFEATLFIFRMRRMSMNPLDEIFQEVFGKFRVHGSDDLYEWNASSVSL